MMPTILHYASMHDAELWITSAKTGTTTNLVPRVHNLCTLVIYSIEVYFVHIQFREHQHTSPHLFQ